MVQHVKKEFGLDFVYCWHALHAYWSGVSPTAAGVESYGSQITIPTPTPGAFAVFHLEAGAYMLHNIKQTCRSMTKLHRLTLLLLAIDQAGDSRQGWC